MHILALRISFSFCHLVAIVALGIQIQASTSLSNSNLMKKFPKPGMQTNSETAR